MGGVMNTISDIISAPGDWLGQGTEWLGERTGIKPLTEAGNWLSDDQNKWAQILATGAMTGGAMYGADMLNATSAPVAGFTQYGEGAAGMEDMLMGLEQGTLGPMYEGSTLGNFGSQVAGLPGYESLAALQGAMPDLQGWGVPLSLLGGMTGSQYLAYNQQKAAMDESYARNTQALQGAQDRAMNTWKQNAFPNAQAVAAARGAGKAAINQQTMLAKRGLDESLAARGFAPGSGAIAGEFGKLERNKVSNMSDLAMAMTQFENTPFSGPPISLAAAQYQTPTTFGERMANTIGGISGTAGGIYTYDWLKKLMGG